MIADYWYRVLALGEVAIEDGPGLKGVVGLVALGQEVFVGPQATVNSATAVDNWDDEF